MPKSKEQGSGSIVRLCVVKLGGSVIATEAWPSRLRNWLREEVALHADTHYVLVVGGGALVDALRDLDAHTPLGDEAAHWAAIRLMEVTARIVGAMLPGISMCDNYTKLRQRTSAAGVTIYCSHQFMQEVEPRTPGTRLPASWDVTSDSIAARLAIVLAADELVLIKSHSVPTSSGFDLEALSTTGAVDRFVHHLAGELPKLRFSVLE